MEPIVSDKPVRAVPSTADWSHLRPIVRELYHDRRWTMDQVRDHLETLGYRVNTRMVRARITQWNLQRNNQIRDMVAALRLLDPDPVLWPSPEPKFLIRGRQVTMGEVLRFFRRKGIQDPVQWARSAALDGEESAVTLLDKGTGTASVTIATGPALGASASESRRPSSPCSSARALSASSGHTPPERLPMHILTLEQRAVASLRDYCAAYIGLGHAAIHQEPQVHQFTVHGRFGDRMQEGLAQMVRRGPAAFPNFRRGFDLVQPLLAECHPMGLAQFLAIVCELAAHTAHSILTSLLRYSAAMASSLRVHGSLTEFLRSLCSSPDMLLQTVVSSLRAALAVFSEQGLGTWHRLYIQERLCDCLYHGRERTEGGARRVQLLREQEAFYGPFARNVIWTVTNVADDHLDAGNIDGGEHYYSMALARAEHLAGFGRAKIRFAALEGLARAERKRFEQLRRGTPTGIDRDLVGPSLQTIYRYVDEALNEALIWFEPTSRRVARIKEQRRYIGTLLEEIGYHNSSPKSSSDNNGSTS